MFLPRVSSNRDNYFMHTWLLASNVYIRTALLDMDTKCGNITDAHLSFISIVKPNVAVWTAMLNGFSHHGLSFETILLFENMVNQGVIPNGATFVGVLSVSAHASWANEGMRYLHLMNELYKIELTIEHFTYVVDLLGQSEHIKEAEELIKEMPFKPDGLMLGALLKACWLRSKFEVGQTVTQKMVDMDPKLISAYMIMSKIYFGIGSWKEKFEVRWILRDLEVKKDPGFSWIDVDNEVCVFFVEDKSHPSYSIIFTTLEHLTTNIYSIMQFERVSNTCNST